MATEKQLAALKKGREAMARKRAGKKPAIKRKSNPVKKRASKVEQKYLIKITLNKGKVGYWVGNSDFDTVISKGRKLTLSSAESTAKKVFDKLVNYGAGSNYFKTIEIIPAPK